MKQYNSFLGAFFSGDNGQGGYNAAYGKSALAKLAMPDLDDESRNAAISGLARVDPDNALKFNQQQQKAVQERQMAQARMLASAPAAQRPALYAAILPGLKKDWKDAPDIYTNELDDMVQAWAGVGQADVPADVRSNQWYLRQLGYKPGSEEERNFLRMRAGQMPKAVPYGIKYDEQGNAWLEDKNQGFIAPAPMGLAGQTPPPAEVSQGADPMASYLERIRMGGEVLAANNVPPDQINAWKEAELAKAQQELSAKGVTFAPPAGTSPQPPQQARVSVKPEAGITPYQEETLRLQREAGARAEAESAARIAKDKAAADAKAADRQARVQSAQATTDNLLTNIRELKKHPGFKELGTLGGNAADSALPEFVPTDYRGAKARLETIKGQIALQAMAELKALSSSGATGFGALAVPELTLLQNSIQTLTTSQNNADILASMSQIERLLTKAKSGAPAGGKGKYSVGQVLVINGKRYQVTGGDMNDPDLKELK